MTKIDLFAGLAGGLGFAVCGPPGTGKSTFLGSTGRYGKAKLFATKPREANSWQYRVNGITQTAETFFDPKWRPTAGKFEANGFVNLIKRLEDFYDDKEHDFVLFDPYTDAVTLAMHELLKVHKVGSFGEAPDSQGLYGQLRQKLEELTAALTVLQFAPRPKHVLVSVHTQAPKEDVKKKGGEIIVSADHRAQGVEYEGNVLPMIEGGYRVKFAGDFDVFVYSDIKHEKKIVNNKMQQTTDYVIQIAPDNDRHAKQTIGAVLGNATMPNDFGLLLQLLRENGVSDERNETAKK